MTELTGKHVLVITVSAFAVIIGVNVLLAVKAVSTFPGLEVENSYVAGQGFNERKSAQEALGWVMVPGYENGRMTLAFSGKDGKTASLPAKERPGCSVADHAERKTNSRQARAPAGGILKWSFLRCSSREKGAP